MQMQLSTLITKSSIYIYCPQNFSSDQFYLYGSDFLKTQPNSRAVMLGQYIVENKATVRATAKKFGISKSTVHKDVSERLQKTEPELYNQVKDILEINKKERHIRGGLATKNKYRQLAMGNSKNKSSAI